MRRWFVTGLMAGTLVGNYVGHRTGWWDTLCTNTRRHIGPDEFDLAWDALSVWMKDHYRRGYS